MDEQQPRRHSRADAQRRQALRDARKADRRPDPGDRRCVACGATEALEKHHIHGRANSDECEWRCKTCHRSITSSQYNMPAEVLAGTEKTPEQIERAKRIHLRNDVERIHHELGALLNRHYEDEAE